MWPRHAEALLGLWLVVSPWLLGAPAGLAALATPLGALIAAASLSCRWPRLRRAHLFTLGAGLALALHAFVQPRPLPPWLESHLLTGLLLAALAVLPTEVNRPPASWRSAAPRAPLPPSHARPTGGANGTRAASSPWDGNTRTPNPDT